MCLPHIRLQLFTLTPIFFYHITHVHLLQFSPPSIPDILCPPRASRGSAIHVFLVCFNETAHDKWCLDKSVEQTENDFERGFVKNCLNSA